MDDRALVRTGAAGAIIAVICCVAPILAVILPLAGLGAWLGGADPLAFSALAVSLGLMAWGLCRRKADAASEDEHRKEA